MNFSWLLDYIKISIAKKTRGINIERSLRALFVFTLIAFFRINGKQALIILFLPFVFFLLWGAFASFYVAYMVAKKSLLRAKDRSSGFNAPTIETVFVQLLLFAPNNSD